MNESAAKQKLRKIKKYLLISAAAVGGGTAIGLTAGFAAPIIIGKTKINNYRTK